MYCFGFVLGLTPVLSEILEGIHGTPTKFNTFRSMKYFAYWVRPIFSKKLAHLAVVVVGIDVIVHFVWPFDNKSTFSP